MNNYVWAPVGTMSCEYCHLDPPQARVHQPFSRVLGLGEPVAIPHTRGLG